MSDTNTGIIDYYHRSYKAADGLWFMKVEEKYGFDAALEIDNEVWKVLPKIQARMIKSILDIDKGPAALVKSLSAKLALEEFKFKIEQTETGFRILIDECPWHNTMVKSGREALSPKVGTTICNTEHAVWLSEFDPSIKFKIENQKCKGAKQCVIDFQIPQAEQPKP